MTDEPRRYSLVKFDLGGLLLDLESGRLFNLNQSATFIWNHWLAGTTIPDIEGRLAEKHALPLAIAREHVAVALATQAWPSSPPSEYLYERAENRYTFSRAGIPVLFIEERGETLDLAGPPSMSLQDLRAILLAISPKLLALRGHFVIHASAVAMGGAATAFCGESGAGKTTTARALVRAGASPLCEDKLVVREAGGRFEVLVGIEETIAHWSRTAAIRLSEGASASCGDLEATSTGETIPLREIGFIDARRRAQQMIRPVALTPLDAAGNVFRNSFYGSDVSDDWNRRLSSAASLAHCVEGYSLTMPAGTDALDTAARELARRGRLRS